MLCPKAAYRLRWCWSSSIFKHLQASSVLDTPHGSSQGLLRLRTAQWLTLAPEGPARPHCRVERHKEAPFKRPYLHLFSHPGAKTERR